MRQHILTRAHPPTFRPRVAGPHWYFDLIAWTAALAVHGYPAVGLLSTYLGIADDRLSVPFRVFVFALAITALWKGKSRAPLRAVDGGLLVFWIVYSLRLLWDTYVAQVPDADTALLFFTVAVVPPVLALALTADSWNDRNVALCFMALGTAICAGGIWLSRSGLVDTTYYEGRLGFEKINPIGLGHVGCTTVLATIVFFEKAGSRFKQAISLISAGLGLAVLYLAESRGPVLALAAAFTAYLLFRKAGWKYAIFVFAGSYAVITIFATVGVHSLLTDLRFTSTNGLLEDRSSLERMRIYQEAIDAFLRNPIIGTSFALPESGGWAHNIFIEAAMALGVVGLVLLVILCLRSFASSVSALRTGGTMSAFLFLQFVVAGQFSGALWGWPGLWIGVALTNALRRRIRKRPANQPVYRRPPRQTGTAHGERSWRP
jgi:O-antigen ligase